MLGHSELLTLLQSTQQILLILFLPLQLLDLLLELGHDAVVLVVA